MARVRVPGILVRLRSGLQAAAGALVLAAWAGPAPAQDGPAPEPSAHERIDAVMARSQRQRLDELSRLPAEPEAEDLIRASFQAVLAVAPTVPPDLALRVVRAPVVAESLLGRVIVASEGLASLPEAHRRFILAHELGHVMEGHWRRMGLLYLKHIPGRVEPALTEAVAPALGREASGLAHEQELAADAYGLQLIEALGHGPEDAVAAFRCFGLLPDTATHPGTRKRMAHLRMLRPH